MKKDLIDFFLETGKVKRQKQRGLVLRGAKDPPTIGSHSFREAFMGWTLAKTSDSGLDSGRIIKLTLIRDLCAGYAGDATPYDPVIEKRGKKNLKEIYKKWVRLSKREKEAFENKKRKRERKALGDLTKKLPNSIAREMQNLWEEYEDGSTREGRFVRQIHYLENFLQSLEYWKEDKKFPITSWWQQMKELITEPLLVELLKALDKTFHGKR